MPWTGLPATQDTDWSALSFAAQFVHAVNERRFAIGFSARTVPSVGSDVQLASFWATLQSDASGIAALDPSASFVGTFSGPTAYPQGMTALQAFTLAGLMADGRPSANFTRKLPRTIASTAAAGSAGWKAYLGTSRNIYVHNGAAWVLTTDPTVIVDTLTAYGTMQAGDYIGPWIFNELQALLNVKYRFRQGQFFGYRKNGSDTEGGAIGAPEASFCAAAQANAETAWAASTESPDWGIAADYSFHAYTSHGFTPEGNWYDDGNIRTWRLGHTNQNPSVASVAPYTLDVYGAATDPVSAGGPTITFDGSPWGITTRSTAGSYAVEHLKSTAGLVGPQPSISHEAFGGSPGISLLADHAPVAWPGCADSSTPVKLAGSSIATNMLAAVATFSFEYA